MDKYLAHNQFIDWQHPSIVEKAQALSVGHIPKVEIAQSCFEFVRDDIKHSMDHQMNPVTCKASDVLKYGTGFCYAKSHLLAALLRANHIPAGICYQRLSIADDGSEGPFCLHALNAIHLDEFGWCRVDPRGNKPGIEAEFCPPVEKLAFSIRVEGERDLPEIWPEPLSVVTDVLQGFNTYQEVADHLPDVLLTA